MFDEIIEKITLLRYGVRDMNSLEFTTRIEHGVIHLPKEFEDYENSVAHVVVTIEAPEKWQEKKERLIAAFRKAQQAKLFQDIEDPVAWQRELRNEWD